MLTQRQSLLARLLIKQNGYKTVKCFAQELNVSERTVHSDLQKIKNSLLEQGYRLDKKTGIGVGIQKTDKVILESKIRTITLSKFNRRKKIIQLLLHENKTVTFDYLSSLFLVSKSSIEHDLKFVKKSLTSNNNLKMISDNSGTRLFGSEKDYQRAYLLFNFFIFEASQCIFDDENERLAILIKYYGESNVRTCFRVLYSHVRTDSNFIAEHYMFNVLNMLVIMVYRAKNGYHIDDIIMMRDDSPIFRKSAKNLLKKISLRLNFIFTEGDINYLSMYLLSNRINTFDTNKHDILLVDKIIANVGSNLFIDFTQDNKLRDYLIQHIPPMLYRLREGIKINNPFVSQIKQDFSLLFNLIWIVISECEKELGIIFNEDEIGFLTIHFQSALERTKHGKKILVVCQNGIATTELLVNRISRILPSLVTIEIASLNEINSDMLQGVDLVISTVNLSLSEVKVIVVSPLLSEQDIKNITKVYNENLIIQDDIDDITFSFLHLNDHIKHDSIFLNNNFNSKNELLTNIGQQLVLQQIITPDFVEGMIIREAMGGTDLPTGVAIPHSNPKFVKQTAIVIVTNTKAIKWNENLVKLIIIICIAEHDRMKLKKILSDIYSLVKNKSVINQLCEKSNSQELINYLKGGKG